MKNICLLSLLLAASCSSPQFIRSKNYYYSDWSAAGVIANSGKKKEPFEHHPIFSENNEYKGGKPKIEKKLNYYIFGNFPHTHKLKIDEICGQKNFKQAYIDHSFVQAFVSFLTLGIYTPRTAKVWCDENS
jgi:hypothetical protein